MTPDHAASTTAVADPGPPDPADERVTFIQHRLPGLDDGSYHLTISQHVDDKDDAPLSGDTDLRTYRFAITGDRFRLANPTAAVASTFPADTDTGEFDTTLPHVVFTSSTFPWSRSPVSTGARSAVSAALGEDADVPTWLAVLTLDDDDVAAFPGLTLDPVTTVVGDLFPVAAYPDTTLVDRHSYFDTATDLAGLQIGEAATDPIQVLDLPLALFTQIAPTLDDLDFSAHVRQLSVQNKLVGLGADAPADPLGTYAIVVGNRLPQDQHKSHAYLVCLEALSNFLPDASGAPSTPSIDQSGTLRLAVLQHWTFFSQGSPAAFTDLLQRLNGRTPGGPDAAVSTLRLDAPAAVPPVSGALADGYVPLAHRLRTGETTVSWVRGPLSPAEQPPDDADLPYSSSDQALILDPTTGLLNASLAAAWSIGRLVALQDKAFAAKLYTWKRGLSQSVVNAAELALVGEILDDLDLATGDQTSPKAVLHATMRLLSGSRHR